MYLKKLFAPVVGLTPAGFWSAAKMQSLLLTLMVVAFWVSPAAVAADKKNGDRPQHRQGSNRTRVWWDIKRSPMS